VTEKTKPAEIVSTQEKTSVQWVPGHNNRKRKHQASNNSKHIGLTWGRRGRRRAPGGKDPGPTTQGGGKKKNNVSFQRTLFPEKHGENRISPGKYLTVAGGGGGNGLGTFKRIA